MRDFRCFALWHTAYDRPLMGPDASSGATGLAVFPTIRDACKMADKILRDTGKRVQVVQCVLVQGCECDREMIPPPPPPSSSPASGYQTRGG